MFRNFKAVVGATIVGIIAMGIIGCGSGGTLPKVSDDVATGITISPAAPLLSPGQTAQLHLAATNKDGSTTDVTSSAVWSSGNAAVASTNSQGQLACTTPGSVKITATSGGMTAIISATCTPGQIIITGSHATNLVGTNAQLQATVNFLSGSTTNITSSAAWSSSAPKIATVDSSGVQTCLSAGSSQISAASAGNTSAVVSILCAVPTLIITPNTASAIVGKPVSFTAAISIGSGSGSDVTASATWTAGPAMISLGKIAQFACVSAGQTTVSASYASVSQAIAVTCIPPSLHTPSYFLESSDEFVGPFPSWVNVKTAYGAVGDGIADDTQAIQNAINNINSSNLSNQDLWFPAGTYKITDQLTIAHKQFFSLIGEDPRTTKIKWAGPQGGIMLLTDSSANFRITRLTFDGSGIADTAEYLTSITQGGVYSGFNEVSDQHILGVNQGVRLGVDAETTVERVFFDHIPLYGVLLETFNTLDIFVTDSLFVGCGSGVSNHDGAGQYVVTNSFFSHSTKSDLLIGNTGFFTARHNTSVGSKHFIYAYAAGDNIALITAQNNTVIDPVESPVMIGNMGPLLMIDNVFRMQSQSVPTMVGSWDPYNPTDIFSIGNTYSNSIGPATSLGDGNIPASQPAFIGRLQTYDDIVADPTSIADVTIPTNVYIPPNLGRPIFEVPQQADTATIQAVIDSAVASNVSHAVVHFKGEYQIFQTIVVPANSNLQLMGDEAVSTSLGWFGSTKGPMFKILSQDASFKNMQLNSNTTLGDGILISVPDQPSTQLLVDQAGLVGNDGTSIFFDAMEHADAELSSFYTAGRFTGLNISGGAFRAAKEATVGITNDYSGAMQSETTGTSFNVFAGGKFMVQDSWHDGSYTSPNNFVLSGSGTVTEQTGTAYMSSASPFVINNFEGNISLIALAFFPGDIVLGPGTSKTNLLTLGLDGGTVNYLPQSTANVTASNVLDSYASGFSYHIAEQELSTAKFMRTMLAQSRTEYAEQRLPLASTGHRIRVSRILIHDASDAAIHVTPATSNPGLYYSFESGDAALTHAQSSSSCVATASGSSNSTNSGWLLLAAGDGDFKIVAVGVNQFLTAVPNISGTSFVSTQDVSDSFGQRWLIRATGDGRFNLVNRYDGSVLMNSSSGCTETGSDPTVEAAKWVMTAH